MTEILIPFDYKKWKNGGKVFNGSGILIEQLTHFAVSTFPYCIAGTCDGFMIQADINGLYNGYQTFFMKQKVKKIFIGVKINESDVDIHPSTHAYTSKEKLMRDNEYLKLDNFKIFELEVTE